MPQFGDVADMNIGVQSLPPSKAAMERLLGPSSKVKFSKIEVKAREALYVGQGDYVVVNNKGHDFKYLETDGAGPCVVVMFRGRERTLLTHLEDTKIPGTDDVKTKGTRAEHDLSEILSKMLDLVDEDHSQIEAVGIVSGGAFKEHGNNHASEVLSDLLSGQQIGDTCTIQTRSPMNDAMVNLETGEMLALSNPLDRKQCVNKGPNGQATGYPKDVVRSGNSLDLVGDKAKDQAQVDDVSLNEASSEPQLAQDANELGDETAETQNAGADENEQPDLDPTSDAPDDAQRGRLQNGGSDTHAAPTTDVGSEPSPETTFDAMTEME